MDLLFEFLIELLFEGAIEGSKSSKIPKPIRFFLIAFIVLIFSFIIGLIFLVGILLLLEKNLGGLFIIIVGILLTVSAIIKLKNSYLNKKEK